MSQLPVYSFFPWLRQGLGNQITAADAAGRAGQRATIPVALELTGSGGGAGTLVQQIPQTPRDIPLAGPGDIVGIESRAVVRTEPRNWITNFEPNYTPCIEFYDEDFPWRYTPAAPDQATHRLRPWIALVVLEEGLEFKEGTNTGDRPLPFITVENFALFPAAAQLWAWAHVHVNGSMVDNALRLPAWDAAPAANAAQPAVTRLEQTLDQNADLAYSRIICPRKLKDNTPYHAFVVPVFESGRLAGLGLDPADAPEVMQSAWAAYPNGAAKPRAESASYPYYYRWYFRTGTVGDFEYLVRLIQPRTADRRVGTREMDVRDPDANLPGITDPALGGVLRLGGALKVPNEALNAADQAWLQKYENWASPYPRPFQEKLARLINLADDYQTTTAAAANATAALTADVSGSDDPLITPPLYGRWHAKRSRLLEERDGTRAPNADKWLHQLNLDPRHRTSAGFGTGVIQKNQEAYMDAAWQQIGSVLEAQRRIRDAQVNQQIALSWHTRYLMPMLSADPERAFALAAPLHGRVVTQGHTVAHLVRQSALPAAAVSAPLRRVLRPRARLAAKGPAAGAAGPQRLLRRLNNREISAAPPRLRPPKLVTPTDIAGRLRPAIPGFLVGWLRRLRALPWIVLLILIAVAVLLWLRAPGPAAGVVLAIAAALFLLLRRWSTRVRQADILDDEHAQPGAVDDLPKSPGFTIAPFGPDPGPALGATDSPEGAAFKSGLRDLLTLIGASRAAAAGEKAKGPKGAPLNFDAVATTLGSALNPQVTIPRRVLAAIDLPERLERYVTEKFQEPFAYPRIDLPMYAPLAEISAELFLPNLNLIEQNSIQLLETRESFIESYMTGLNHEFARELLWREYPTDQRGSYFRQFWDVSAFLDPAPDPDPERQKDKLRDITRLHEWKPWTTLEDHNNRKRVAGQEDLVLTIRGELLKKYPNAVIYAHRAEWQLKEDGSGAIDPSKERIMTPLSDLEQDNPPRDKVRTPLYGAKVDPDIFFFGFDLTAAQVKGGTGENSADDPGWFFVIKERPGEPRFGFDIGGPAADKINVWNDLGWDNVQPGAAGSYVQLDNAMTAYTVTPPAAADQEKQPQHIDDVAIRWNSGMNAADVAYVLFQAPMLVAIHAAEMLKPKS